MADTEKPLARKDSSAHDDSKVYVRDAGGSDTELLGSDSDVVLAAKMRASQGMRGRGRS